MGGRGQVENHPGVLLDRNPGELLRVQRVSLTDIRDDIPPALQYHVVPMRSIDVMLQLPGERPDVPQSSIDVLARMLPGRFLQARVLPVCMIRFGRLFQLRQRLDRLDVLLDLADRDAGGPEDGLAAKEFVVVEQILSAIGHGLHIDAQTRFALGDDRLHELRQIVPEGEAVSDEEEPWKEQRNEVKYVPLQPQEGDLAVYLQSGGHEIIFNNERYVVVSHNSILLLIRDEGLFE